MLFFPHESDNKCCTPSFSDAHPESPFWLRSWHTHWFLWLDKLLSFSERSKLSKSLQFGADADIYMEKSAEILITVNKKDLYNIIKKIFT